MTQLTKKQYSPVEKITFSVCVAAVLVLIYGLTQFKSSKMKFNANESAQINYEMAKLKHAESLYSLENREIELYYKALEAQKAAQAVADKKVVADKAKKAAEAKKTQAAAVQQTQKKSNIQAVQRATTSRFATIDTYFEQKEAPESKSSPAQYANYSNQTPAEIVNPEEAKGRSFEDWKAEIFAAQNREAILKLTAAYKKGEVSQETFQRLVNDMLNSGDDKMVGLGLYALRANPSYANYVRLIKAEGQVSSNYNAYIQEALISYHQSGLGVYKQALNSSDRTVVLKTLEVLRTGVTSIKSGTTANMVDPRQRRLSSQSQFSLSNYQSFIPTLQNLMNSSDQDIRSLAQANITLIDDPQYIASN